MEIGVSYPPGRTQAMPFIHSRNWHNNTRLGGCATRKEPHGLGAVFGLGAPSMTVCGGATGRSPKRLPAMLSAGGAPLNGHGSTIEATRLSPEDQRTHTGALKALRSRPATSWPSTPTRRSPAETKLS